MTIKEYLNEAKKELKHQGAIYTIIVVLGFSLCMTMSLLVAAFVMYLAGDFIAATILTFTIVTIGTILFLKV